MKRRVKAVMKKEFIQIIRDPRSLAVAVILPIILLLLYGYGINLDIKQIKTAVLNQDNTATSRQVLDAFKMSEYFKFEEILESYQTIDRTLDSGKVRAVIVIPRGFSADLKRGSGEIQILTDGSDPSAAGLASSYAAQITLAFTRNLRITQLKRLGAGNVSLPTVDPRIRYWYNPELNSTNYIVPGLIAVILMLLSSLLTSMTIVRERERGTIEQVMVSPIKPIELMVGKIIPYVAIAFLDIVLVIVGSKFIFGVPLLGSVPLLLVLSGVFLLSALGLGLLISSVSGSQLVAMTIAVTVTMLPAILLSGFVFPISAMPPPMRAVTYLIPARYYLGIIRGIFLKGVGLETLWPQALILLIMGAGLVVISARNFRKVISEDMSWRRIVYITRKELLQVRRDPKMMRLMFLAPIFQLLIFGYAITSDVQHITTAVLDMDNTSQSREYVRRFTSVPRYFKVVETLDGPQPIDKLLDSGKAQMALWIPKGFAADLGRGKQAEVQFILDASDSKTASIIGGYVNAITAGFSRDVLARFAVSSGGSLGALPQIDARVRVWYNPDMRSVNFMVPGVISLILLIVTMMNTSLAVVREREIGTLEQLVVTPIRPIELMIGKIAPFVLMGIIEVLLIVAMAVLWFKVPIAGSVLLLFALTVVFLSTSLGLGLLVSTVSHTQQQAMMTSFFVIQPSIMLSGFMFPIESMPRVIQIITYAIPLRYFVEIIRGIFLRGVGLDVLWPQALLLFVLGALLLGASVVRFTKKVG